MQMLRAQYPDSVDVNSQLSNNVSGLYMKLMEKSQQIMRKVDLHDTEPNVHIPMDSSKAVGE